MIIRVVKLTFKEDKIDQFLSYFDGIKQHVNSFQDCHGMQLLQDSQNKNIVFTYSKWENDAALEKYRTSDLFGSVWPTIKPWFALKTEAWTLNSYFDGFENK
jgi:quinol monooxygenase YgiN